MDLFISLFSEVWALKFNSNGPPELLNLSNTYHFS
jgi:hypothetical protein